MRKPLAIDIFCGLGGWTSAFLAEGYRVIGYDIERHDYGNGTYPGQLVLQDARTLDGARFKNADVIVCSPPCQEFSYMAMPWSRAKKIAAEYQSGERDRKKLTELFDACFRIQREASEAAGRKIPMVVENVCGAQRWVGRAKWHCDSYYLWGDVPALMPTGQYRKQTLDGSWFYKNYEKSARRFSSGSQQRRQWSAEIAKIPFPLAQWIARVFKDEKTTQQPA